MAVRSDEASEAIKKVEAVSQTLHAHIGAQAVVNETLSKGVDRNTEDIFTLRLDAERKNGAMDLMGADVKRILSMLDGGQRKFLSWFGALTPWAFVLFGLIYFYVTNKGGAIP